ncbi:hypothetical protein BHM03_00012580 [Ensete ventricosum]|nr:hypothetical protein BHM03_00012580 [Ensete ventricosum]
MIASNSSTEIITCYSKYFLWQVRCPSIFDQAEKYISLIIPAFNEEHRLPGAFAETINYLQKRSASDKSFSFELHIELRTVNQGFSYRTILPGTGVAALQLCESIVKQGMLHSRGELLLMLDADGATKITDLEKLECQVV